MESTLLPLAIVAVVLLKLMQRTGVSLDTLLGARRPDNAFRSAVAGRYAHLMTLIVIALLVLIALDPEARLFFMVIDAIGFDLLVALFALQIRGIAAGAWQVLRMQAVRLRCEVWTFALGLRPRVLLAGWLIAFAYGCAWIGAHIGARILNS